MGTRILAALAGLLLSGQALAAGQTPEQRYDEAAAVLAKGCLGTGCDFGISTPKEQAALQAVWESTQAWTVAFLNSHPGLRGEKLQTELLNRSGTVAPADIQPLVPGLFAVFAQYGEMGNVFLVREQAGRFSVTWDIRNARDDAEQFPVLRAWRDDQVREECRQTDGPSVANCGPLFADTIRMLPPDTQGRTRFYLNATYAQAAETTVGGQLSIWLLDGTTPKIVWAKRYAYNFEDVSWKRDGDLLKIRATDWWHTLFACGSCIGRQMDWTIRIRPDRVDDLGMKPVVPELDTFDDLAWRIFKGKNVDELATPEVASVMRKFVAAEKTREDELAAEAKDKPDPDWFSFGMLEGYTLRKVPGGSELCVGTDDVGFRLRFAKNSNRLVVVELAQLPESDVGFCHKQTP